VPIQPAVVGIGSVDAKIRKRLRIDEATAAEAGPEVATGEPVRSPDEASDG
jgi:hypothetical protein